MPLVGSVLRLDLEDVTVLGPDIEAAADAAIGADGFRAADSRFAHRRLGLGDLQNRADSPSPARLPLTMSIMPFERLFRQRR